MKSETGSALLPAMLMLASVTAYAGEEDIHLRPAPGSELTTGRCILCHSLDYLESNASVMNRSGWQRTIKKMIERYGAPITEVEAQEILRYLSENYVSAP